jgi:hypothetical protein
MIAPRRLQCRDHVKTSVGWEALEMIMRFMCMASALVLSAGVASADSITIEPSADATLYEGFETSNGAGENFFAGATTRFGVRHALIRFDIATSVPAGSTINGATLTLFMNRSILGPAPFTLHRVSAGWNEGLVNAGEPGGAGDVAQDGDATWDARIYNVDPMQRVPWTTPGGDYLPASAASTVVDGVGSYSWTSAQLAFDAQQWLDAPATNFGWLLRANAPGASAKRFSSRESTDEPTRPRLVIEFTPPGPTCNDIDINNDGGFFDPQDIDAFLSVFSEGPCLPETATCDDIDFNNDGAQFDPCDIDSFLLVFAEGPCTACGV